MSKLWKIYRQGADVETDKAVVEVHELEYHGEWMKDEYVSVTVKSHEPVEFRIGDWLEYRGDTFVIDYDPNVIKKARRESYGEAFVYDSVKLYSLARELRNVAFKDYVLNWDSKSNTNAYSAQDKFSFFAGSVDDLADRIQANLDRALGKGTWRVMTPNEFRTNQRCSAAGWSTYYGYGGMAGRTDISINADTINCEEALAAAYEQFGMSYVTIGRLIVIGGDPLKVSKEFMYGKGKGLYEIERTTDDNSKVVTRLSAYGSSQNLPLNYYANLHKKAYAIVKWPIEEHETQFKRLDLVTDIPWSDVKDVFTTVNDVVLTNASGVSVHSEFYAHKETMESPQVLLFRLGLWVEEDMSADWIEKKAFFDSLTIGSKVYLSYGVDINAWPQTMVEVGQDSMKLLTINNVMMPGFPDESLYEWIKENGGTDCDDATGQATYNGKTYIFSQDRLSPWIQSMKAATMGVREGSIYFDGSGENKEIMPSIEDTGADVVITGSNIQDNGYITEENSNIEFKIVVANGILDWENAIGSSDKLTVSMKTGYCVGREFEVKKAELKDNGYELTLVRQKDGDRYFPYYDNSVSGYCQIKATDKFVVLGLNVQSNFDGYVQAAAVKVLEAALESLDEVDHIEPTYIPKIDEIYMARQHDAVKEGGAAIIGWGSVSLHDTFRAGMQMEITDKEDLQVEHLLSYIDTITIKENGNNGIPTYDVVLRNKKDESVLKKLEKKIVDVSSGGISAKGGTISSGGGSGSGSGGGGGTSGVYLSKRDDDEAQGVIGFLNGLWVGARDWFFDQLGNIKANTVTTDGDVNVGGAEHVSGDANIDGLLRVNDIKSTNYTGEGMVGTGYMITSSWGGTQDSGAVFDYLTIRKKMIINSLEIKETEFSAGDQAFSGANMKVARTDYLHYDEATNTWTELGYSTTRVPWVLRGIPFLLSKFGLDDRARKMYGRLKKLRMAITQEDLKRVNRIRLYFLAKDGDREIENWWRVNDLARCQTQNLINTQQRETYVTDLEQHQGNIYWWRKVMRVSVNTGEPRYIWYDEEGNTSDKAVEGWTKKRGYNGTVANEVDYPGMTEDLYPTKAEDYGQPITIDGQKYHWIEVAYNYDEEVAAFAQGKHTGWCACYSDLPAVNDKVVQFGNAEDPDRMNVTTIEINGSGNPDAPAIKIYRGIFSFDNSQSWWGGKPQKMKLSPSTGYEFYGPMFKFVQEYGVARIHKAREEVYWSGIGFERDDEEKQTYPAYSDDVLNPNGTFKSRKDTTKTDRRYVRKCYYYDEVTHKGSLWLCTIANETYYWRWDGTSAITINSHTYQQGDWMLDSDYRSLTTEQKAQCGRYRSYATTEPSEASGEWTKIVEKGDKGSSPVQAFRWYKGDITPQRPTEAAEEPDAVDHINDGEAYPADHWSKDAVNRPDDGWHLWMVTNTLYGDGTYGTWSTPMRISGATGSPGEDSSDTEWIYKRNNDGQTPSTPPNSGKGKAGSVTKDNWTADEVAHTDDWVPDGWTDNPQGIEPDMKYEFASFRVKPRGHNEAWGPFQTPITWSHWGRNGLDGDGVEYVFIRTNTNVPPTISESEDVGGGNAPYDGKTYKDDEFLPLSSEGRCTDDDLGPDENNKYEWCMKRRMTDPDTDTGQRTWTKYVGTMNLWNRWADNAVRLALDNEHEDFLYNDAGTLISPANGATSDIHLYDGHNDKTSQTTLRVYDDGAGQWVTSTGASATAAASISGNRLNVAGLRAASVKVRVRGEYPVGSGQGQFYFAEFTANKTNQDKYDLVLKPNAIAFNESETWANKTITPSADRTDLQGNKTTGLTINTSEVNGLRLYYSYVKTDGTLLTPALNLLTASAFTLTETNAKTYIGIYFELRLYTGSTYRMCDYETVEIAKSKNGESAFIIDLDNEEDAFGVDKDGDVIETQTRRTHVHMFYGTQKQNLTITSIALKYADAQETPITPSSSTINYSKSGDGTDEGTVSVTAYQGFRLLNNVYVDITAQCTIAGQTKSITHRFTIGLRRHGEDGVSPTFYQLAPTIDSFVFHRNADNTIERDTQTSQINVLEIHGGSEPRPISPLPAGYSIRYGFVGSSSSPTTIALGGNVEVTEQHVEEGYSRVWVELLNGSTSEDRETLPIVVDGENGANGADGKDGANAAVLELSMSAIVYQADGNGVAKTAQTFYVYPSLIVDGNTATLTTLTCSPLTGVTVTPELSRARVTLTIQQNSSPSGAVTISASGTTGGKSYTASAPVTFSAARAGAQGDYGRAGRFYYYAGPWDDEDTYAFERTQAPYVKASDGKFYMLDYAAHEDYQQSDITRYSQDEDPADPEYASGNPWTEMESQHQYYIATAFFGDQAHFGSAVINKDWMISQHGTVDGVATQSGSNDYIRFNQLFPLGNEKVSLLTSAKTISESSSSPTQVIRFNVVSGCRYAISTTGHVSSSSCRLYVSIVRADTGATIVTTRSTTSTSETNIHNSGNQYDHFTANGFTAVIVRAYISNTSYVGYVDSVTLEPSNGDSNIFVPNYALDMRIGKTYQNTGVFRGTLDAAIYAYHVYDYSSVGEDVPTNADFFQASTSNNTYVVLPAVSSVPQKKITVFNPTQRPDDSLLIVRSADSNETIISLFALSGGSTTYEIGKAKRIEFWADPTGNGGKSAWRVIERIDW